MNYLKTILKPLEYFIIAFISMLLILTLFNYFNILNYKVINLFKFIIPFIAVFIGSIKLGKSISKKGYVEGAKYGAIVSLLFVLSNIIAGEFNFIKIINILIIIVISILGSIIGINRHINEK